MENIKAKLERLELNVAANLNNLAESYRVQGKLDAAEPLCVEALAICRRLFANSDHDGLGTCINNLAALYQLQGKLDRAEPLYVEALAMRRRLFKDRDHNSLAASINNLALLYQAQGKLDRAEPLYVEALAMRQRLFAECDHNSLATSINNLAGLYQAQGKLDRAFPLLLEAVAVEDNILRQWFGYSSEENRLGFVQGMQVNLKILVSFLCQYFPQDRDKIAQVAIAVARRKAFAAQAEVELNYLRYSDRYPDLTADFAALATAQSQLTTLNHDYHARGNDPDPQLKQTLIDLIDRLERKLSANVPELRQLQQHITIDAIVDNLPKYSHAIEFYRFDVYDFAAPRGENWKSPKYVAFSWSDLGVQLIQLGDAEEIDKLISEYRTLAQDAKLPSFGVRPKSPPPADLPTPDCEKIPIDLQLSQRLLSPILTTLNWQDIDLNRSIVPQLIFVPDGNLHTLPIGNLPIDLKVPINKGDTGVSPLLSDYFTCTYLSTLRELLPRIDRPNRSPNPAMAIAHPNYDYPFSPTLEPVGAGTMRSLMSQLGATFAPIPESEILLDRLQSQLADNLQVFTQDRATETVLKRARSPQSLVIITHGYSLNRQREQIGLVFALLRCPEGEEIDLIQAHQQLIDRSFSIVLKMIADWLDSRSENGGSFCRSIDGFLRENYPELIDRVATAVDPLQQHGLALAGANSWLAGEELPAEMGKGFLLARDVAYLDLWDTELAIAIACSSGMGDVKNGEGIFGLRRAFAIAGVKTLITSLWDVPTRPTMLLTDKFFEAYHRGVTPAIALQTAQRYLRNVTRDELVAMELGAEILNELQGYSIKIPDPNYPLRHPFFWGAWICQGYTR